MSYSGYMTDRELAARIARAPGGKASYKQLVRELGLGGGRERRLLLEQLARMTARGALSKPDRDHWCLPQKNRPGASSLLAGRLDLHRDGFGFVRPNPRAAALEPALSGDIFIPPDQINGAMQGDQVLVELEPARAGNRLQGRIRRILSRRNTTVVGLFHYARSDRAPGHSVQPFDERMAQPILIPFDAPLPSAAKTSTADRVLGREAQAAAAQEESLEGQVVDVEILDWPTATRPARGRILEILGSPDDFGVDVEMMIRKHQLPRSFSEAVLAEARSVARIDPAELPHRRDFRGLPIVTIDGESAKDFDDAVYVEEQPDGGWLLQVHIADVSHYVQPGSLLDLEARLRGTSVYFPDRAIPMLPQELSTDICSLRPGQDRLVLSCLIRLDAEARILGYEVVEGLIRSAARMTYTEVHAILSGDRPTRERYAQLVPAFERMQRLAQLMNRRRSERGSIDFDLPEPVIDFDEQGQMRGVSRSERTWANRLIEEFMLAANECVASWLEDLAVPSLYRIHEKPEPRRIVEFEELAASFGFSLGLGPLPVKRLQTRGDRRQAQRSGRTARVLEIPEEIAVTPRMYQKLAQRIEGLPEERILSYLMLRSLRQARYSESNLGHFALAAPSYTHFTSPIRRYPDLIVHRIAKSLLHAGVSGEAQLVPGRLASPWSHPNEGSRGSSVSAARPQVSAPAASIEPPIPLDELALIADESSQAERRAAEAERELVEWKKVRFMQNLVGDEFSALVLNPTKYGLFVELTDLFVEGLIPIDSLRDDRYSLREQTHELIGERWGRHFQVGDRIQVLLDRILVHERKLQFSLVEDELPLTSRTAPKKSSKAKKKAHAKAKKARHSAPPPWSSRAPKSRKPKGPHGKRSR